jgi:cysteinyl-tRNA synthetase
VRLWLHKRRIDLAGAKMSKSLGNVLQLPDIVAKGYSPQDLRYYLLSVHYRTNLKFAWKGMDDAKSARRSIIEWMQRDGRGEFAPIVMPGQELPEARPKDIEMFMESFISALNDDLNTSAALASIFECIHKMNTSVIPNALTKDALLKFIKMITSTFGCFEPEALTIPADVQELVKQRQRARDTKDFAESDRLRKAIGDRGYVLRDSAGGQEVKKL